MAFVLVALIAFGAWFVSTGEIKVRSPRSIDANAINVKIYAPVEQNTQCRRVSTTPVFKDLEPPTHL